MISKALTAFIHAGQRTHLLTLTALGILFFIPFLGKVHLFDWDEINFAESAREMLVTGEYFRVQINFEGFWEKPPFFFWLQAASMSVFGINEFAARFPNALFGIISLVTIYLIGKKNHNSTFALIWSFLYFGTFLPHFYYKSGIIDPVFNYFIFLSIYFIYQAWQSDKHILLSLIGGLCIGIAFITKGPVGLLLVMLTVVSYVVIHRFKTWPYFTSIIVYAMACLAVVSIWIIPEVTKNGFGTINDFILYQIRLFSTPDAGHKQPIYYHFLVVLLGCFPASFFLVARFFQKKGTEIVSYDFEKWMLCLFWVVMILFSIVTTKIVHYSSMSYLPLSYVAALYLYRLHLSKNALSRITRICLTIFAGIFSGILALFPILLYQKTWLTSLLSKDPFAVACLSVPVSWSPFDWMFGVIYFMAVVWIMNYLSKGKIVEGILMLSIASVCILSVLLTLMAPRIEQYSQGPMIRFFESHVGKDVYVYPASFKSYAQYFYFQQPNDGNSKRTDIGWLLNGPIDKPVYFVAKVNRTDEVEMHGTTRLLYQEGGYKFYVREKR